MPKRRATPRRPPRATTAREAARKKVTKRTTRRTPRGKDTASPTEWRTAITLIKPNKILVRGYPLDELMGRVSFAEAIYLVLSGEVPSPAVGRLMEALLVSSIDHGATPPSTLAACNVATTGAPLRAAVAAGVLAFGSPLGGGGTIEACRRFLDDGLDRLVGEWVSDSTTRHVGSSTAAHGRRQDATGVRAPVPHTPAGATTHGRPDC